MKDEIGCVKELILILKNRKKVKLLEVAETLKVPENELEILCKRLERSGMLTVKYPWIGPIKIVRAKRFKEFLDMIDKLIFILKTKRFIRWRRAKKTFKMTDFEMIGFLKDPINNNVVVVRDLPLVGRIITRGKRFGDYLSPTDELVRLKELSRKESEDSSKLLVVTRENMILVDQIKKNGELSISKAKKIVDVREQAFDWILKPLLENEILIMSERLMKEPLLRPGPRMDKWLTMARIKGRVQ